MEPDQSTKNRLYQFYQLIFESDFAAAKKRTLMTGVLGYEEWSWRVIGLSEDAIRAIALNEFKHPPRMLSRDHAVPRVQTYNRVFASKLGLDEWWNLVWENDKTTLVTNDEHHAKSISRVYPIDPNLGLFSCSGVAGWRHRKGVEGAFVKRLCELHGIDYNSK